MSKLGTFKSLLTRKKLIAFSGWRNYVFCGSGPLCDQVEGVLDGVLLSWAQHTVALPGGGGPWWLLLPLLLFIAGMLGVGFTQSNFLRLLLALEVLLLGVNLNFILFAAYFTALWGQVFALLIVAVGAAEAAVGLSILISLYRVGGTVALHHFRLLRG